MRTADSTDSTDSRLYPGIQLYSKSEECANKDRCCYMNRSSTSHKVWSGADLQASSPNGDFVRQKKSYLPVCLLETKRLQAAKHGKSKAQLFMLLCSFRSHIYVERAWLHGINPKSTAPPIRQQFTFLASCWLIRAAKMRPITAKCQ